jgi:hypothetical protein
MNELTIDEQSIDERTINERKINESNEEHKISMNPAME